MGALDGRPSPGCSCWTSGRAEALCDYDARELDVESGEMVKLHHEHGGWWSERANGATGWLPARELELLEENCK